MAQKTGEMHGRDHLPLGRDPIPGIMVESPGNFSEWAAGLPGVWAYWPLQEASGDAIDQGALNADLQPVGTPAYQATGPNTDDLEFAVRLTGSPQTTISDDSFWNTADELNVTTYTDISVLCWIYPDSGATITWRLPIIGTWDAFRDGWVLYLQESTRDLVWANGNGSSTDFLIGPTVPLDEWSLVGATRASSGAVSLYVNGAEVDSATVTSFGGGASGTAGIRLGSVDFASSDPDSYHFYGNMAGAVFVNSVLTGGDMLDAYTAGITVPETGGTFDPATATEWWFPLVDSDGTVVLDGDGSLIPTLIPL